MAKFESLSVRTARLRTQVDVLRQNPRQAVIQIDVTMQMITELVEVIQIIAGEVEDLREIHRLEVDHAAG